MSENIQAPLDIKKTGPWILLATILGSSMVFIDSNVVNVALPRLQADLNVSATDVQWVVEAYSLFLTAYMDALKVPPTVRQALVAQSSKLAGTEVPPGIEGALRGDLSRAIALSFVDAFRLAMWIGAGLALAGALCALFLVEGKTKKDSQGIT